MIISWDATNPLYRYQLHSWNSSGPRDQNATKGIPSELLRQFRAKIWILEFPTIVHTCGEENCFSTVWTRSVYVSDNPQLK